MLGKSSKNSRGRTSPSARSVDNLQRDLADSVWLASGIAFDITHEVAAPADDRRRHRIGRSSRYGLMPHAIITTISRSADSRPKRDEDADQQRHRDGQRRAPAGSSVTISRSIVGHGTPLAIICSAEFDDERDNQDEREDEQRDAERRDDFPNHVPVDAYACTSIIGHMRRWYIP